MTVQEYAIARGLKFDSSVRKAIKFGHKLPGVLRLEKFGHAHVLIVDERVLAKYLETA